MVFYKGKYTYIFFANNNYALNDSVTIYIKYITKKVANKHLYLRDNTTKLNLKIC